MTTQGQAVETAAQLVAGEVSTSIEDCEKAALDWGVQPDHLEGRFVASLLTVIRSLSRLVTAATSDVKESIRSAKEIAEVELAKLKEANRLAILTIRQAEVAQEVVVTNVVKGLVKNITSESAQWLVMAETNIQCKRARIFAMQMTLSAFALVGGGFASGYQLRTWEDEPAVRTLARCVTNPFRVIVAGEPKGEWVCRMETVAPRGWQDLPDEAKRIWLKVWPFARGEGV